MQNLRMTDKVHPAQGSHGYSAILLMKTLVRLNTQSTKRQDPNKLRRSVTKSEMAPGFLSQVSGKDQPHAFLKKRSQFL
jgi:hypothetical protein